MAGKVTVELTNGSNSVLYILMVMVSVFRVWFWIFSCIFCVFLRFFVQFCWLYFLFVFSIQLYV